MSEIIDNNQENTLLKNLKSLGLSDKESRVYLALLSLGETGASAIVSKTGLHRQFVYDTLASLEEKGLVGHVIVRGRKKFLNHNISQLSAMFDQKKRVADEVVSQLEKTMLPADIQKPEIYRGREVFMANEFDTLKSISPNSKIYIFGGDGDEYMANMGKYMNEYEYNRIKKGVELIYMGIESQKSYLSQSKDTRQLFKYRILPSGFSGNLNITVFEDRVCVYIYGPVITNFTIRSKRIAKSYTDFFLGLWEISK